MFYIFPVKIISSTMFYKIYYIAAKGFNLHIFTMTFFADNIIKGTVFWS